MEHEVLAQLVFHLPLHLLNLFLAISFQIVKRDRKSYIINISKEYSIVSQFTSFVAIEEREKVRLLHGSEKRIILRSTVDVAT